MYTDEATTLLFARSQRGEHSTTKAFTRSERSLVLEKYDIELSLTNKSKKNIIINEYDT